MKIDGNLTGGIRGLPDRDIPAPAPAGKEAAAAPATKPTPRDGVEVSAAGQALAQAAGLTPARIEEVRQRILQGAYDQTHIIDAVAKRILQSGDL